MPTFNEFVYDQDKNLSSDKLALAGAYVPVEIDLPPPTAKVVADSNVALPKPITGMGLIDTGSSFLVAHERSLIALGLKPIDVMPCYTPDGPTDKNIYVVRLTFPTMGVTIESTRAIGANLEGQKLPTDKNEDVVALIGRSIFQKWVFTYNGAGFWSIST